MAYLMRHIVYFLNVHRKTLPLAALYLLTVAVTLGVLCARDLWLFRAEACGLVIRVGVAIRPNTTEAQIKKAIELSDKSSYGNGVAILTFSGKVVYTTDLNKYSRIICFLWQEGSVGIMFIFQVFFTAFCVTMFRPATPLDD